jgi:hypothetical protein
LIVIKRPSRFRRPGVSDHTGSARHWQALRGWQSSQLTHTGENEKANRSLKEKIWLKVIGARAVEKQRATDECARQAALRSSAAASFFTGREQCSAWQ